MKGGAVKDDKSPLKEAIDLRNEVQDADSAIVDVYVYVSGTMDKVWRYGCWTPARSKAVKLSRDWVQIRIDIEPYEVAKKSVPPTSHEGY